VETVQGKRGCFHAAYSLFLWSNILAHLSAKLGGLGDCWQENEGRRIPTFEAILLPVLSSVTGTNRWETLSTFKEAAPREGTEEDFETGRGGDDCAGEG
jgi:hypothetical protein